MTSSPLPSPRDNRFFDISPVISSATPVWPGDTQPSREILQDISRGDGITLSTLHTTVHVGAHVDAPSHFHSAGVTADQLSLTPYLGICQVVHARATENGLITQDSLSGPVTASRLLIATGALPDPAVWRDDFPGIDPALIGNFARTGGILLGVDLPSVDPANSRDLPAHQACFNGRIAILEGIDLRNVPDGHYELIALPLPLKGFDASPVRAVLRQLDVGSATSLRG